MKNVIPSDLISAYVAFATALGYRVTARSHDSLTYDQWGRVMLDTFHDSWADVTFHWEADAKIVPHRRSSDPQHYPLCGGRLVRNSYSIGD